VNSQIFKQAQHLVAQNSAAILTGTGVIGVVTTAILTGRATLKADLALKDEHTLRQHKAQAEADPDYVNGKVADVAPLSIKEQLKVVAPIYAPAVASGITTIGAIVFSYRISVSKSAALAAAYGISEKAFQEYKDKVIENVTPKKAADIQDSVDQQKIADNPPPDKGIMIIGSGEVLCLDAFSGTYFQTSVEKIRRAENEINTQLGMHGKASLGDFYEKIGMKQTDISEAFAWTSNSFCEVDFTTQMTEDNRPCLVLGFVNAPRPIYDDI
jgi:Family of unknown function (DUF6353)